MENIEFVVFEHAPATEPFTSAGRTFTPAQLNIIGAALKAGLFYQDALRNHCREAWMSECPAVDVRITGDDGHGYELLPEEFKAKRERINEIRKTLTASPRGTWALLGNPWTHDDGRRMRRLEMYISVGDGDVYEPQTSCFSDADTALPGFAEAHASMVSMDIYLARRADRGPADGGRRARQAQRPAGRLRALPHPPPGSERLHRLNLLSGHAKKNVRQGRTFSCGAGRGGQAVCSFREVVERRGRLGNACRRIRQATSPNCLGSEPVL